MKMPIVHFKHVFKLPFISAGDGDISIAIGGNIIHFIVNLCLLCPSPVLLLVDINKHSGLDGVTLSSLYRIQFIHVHIFKLKLAQVCNKLDVSHPRSYFLRSVFLKISFYFHYWI